MERASTRNCTGNKVRCRHAAAKHATVIVSRLTCTRFSYRHQARHAPILVPSRTGASGGLMAESDGAALRLSRSRTRVYPRPARGLQQYIPSAGGRLTHARSAGWHSCDYLFVYVPPRSPSIVGLFNNSRLFNNTARAVVCIRLPTIHDGKPSIVLWLSVGPFMDGRFAV